MLVAIAPTDERKGNGNVVWLCRCDCGREHRVSTVNITRVSSCGCQIGTPTHGHTRGRRFSPTYSAWTSIIARCERPSQNGYKDYGARGITVCERWRESFANFLADMGEKPLGMTIDRLDNGRGYEPGNCRWATHSQQASNRRSTKLRPHNVAQIQWLAGVGMWSGEIAGLFGISATHVRRVVRGEKCVTA